MKRETPVGVWGASNFEGDGALDYLAKAIVEPLIAKIASVLAEPSLAEPDEPSAAEIMVAVEVLCLLCKHCGAVPPKPELIREASEVYLRVWDGYIDKLMPKPDYKRERREVIKSTWQRLHQLAQDWHKQEPKGPNTEDKTMEITAAAVKALRDRTNAPMMDCKAALVEAGGDMDKAADILRKKNKAIMDKKGERETAEGRIASFIDPGQQIGALVEVRCESAPVVKSEQFGQLANDIAKQVALKDPKTTEELLAQAFVGDAKKTVNDRVAETVGLIRENMKPARMVRLTGQLGSYIHHDFSVGVMVQVEGKQADVQTLRDVCMHITAKNPLAARKEDIAKDVIDREIEIAKSQIAADPKNKNKPANILEKIAEGKMKTWFAENVLLEQPFVKDDSKTVNELLNSAGVKLVKFVRLKVGELSK